MILMPDLFSFAYVPNWYSQLDMLAEMALPEPWRFKNPIYLTKNSDTPILERYIHAIFKKQLIDYKEERIPSNAAKFFHMEHIPDEIPAWRGIRLEVPRPAEERAGIVIDFPCQLNAVLPVQIPDVVWRYPVKGMLGR